MKTLFTSLSTLLLSLFTLTGLAQETLDQFATAPDGIGGTRNPTSLYGGPAPGGSDGNKLGQSFTCGITGRLSKVAIHVANITGSAIGTLEVHSGPGDGGTLLATQAVTFTTGYFSVILTSTINVISGSQYTFLFNKPGQTNNDDVEIYEYYDSDDGMGNIIPAYAAGDMYGGFGPQAFSDQDLDFETYIIPTASCPMVTTSVSSQTNVSCFGNNNGAATVSATGGSGFTYAWAPGGVTTSSATGLIAGTYSCVVTNSCNNTATQIVTITQPSSITVSVMANTSTICLGSTSTLSSSAIGGLSPYTFNWISGPNTSSNVVSPPSTTVYTVNVLDAVGCSKSNTVGVTVTNCFGPVLTGTSCGVTLTSLNQTLNFSSVSGATNYKLEITNSSQPFNVVNVRGNNLTTFNMTWVSGIQYGRTYNIRIAAYVGGVWQAYGNTCTVTTPAVVSIPTTQLSTCGITLSTISQALNFTSVIGATNYELEIVCAAQSFSVVNIRGNNITNFNMSWVAGIQYNRIYDIRISAYVNNSWQPYGSSCQITTPANIPTTQLSTNSCGITTNAINHVLNFDGVAGASNYKVQVINSSQPLNVISVRNSNATTFNLAFVSGIQLGKTYDITVASYVGGVWSTFGPVCQVTTPLSRSARFDYNEDSETIDSDINISTYPNPMFDILNIDFDNLPDYTSVEIYNSIGELVLVQGLTHINNTINTNQLSNGLYHAKVIGNGKLLSVQKIIKQ